MVTSSVKPMLPRSHDSLKTFASSLVWFYKSSPNPTANREKQWCTSQSWHSSGKKRLWTKTVILEFLDGQDPKQERTQIRSRWSRLLCSALASDSCQMQLKVQQKMTWTRQELQLQTERNAQFWCASSETREVQSWLESHSNVVTGFTFSRENWRTLDNTKILNTNQTHHSWLCKACCVKTCH